MLKPLRRFTADIWRISIATMALCTPLPFALPGGEQIEATIADVHRDGILTLRHADGTMHDYAFKEVAFVI